MRMKPLTAFILAIGLLGLGSGRAFAQTDFSGTWMLDKDISGDLSKATFEPQQTQTRRNAGGFSGGFGGRGFGGRNGSGARPAGGTDDGRGTRGTPLTDEEKARLRELALFVKGLASIVIEHSDHSTFTVTDAQGRSHLFLTDGARTPQAFATTTVDAVTKWDGPHMVTDYTIGPSHDLIFTYILVPATRQLALRIQLDDAGRARADVPELKLVYKLKPAAPKAPSVVPH
jgi:hypothetical protein